MMSNKTLALMVFLLSTVSSYAQLDSTNLPIFILDTQGQAIIDDPKTMTRLKVIHNKNGKYNKPGDAPNEYDGFAGFEYRGSSSQDFPKKPFGFELWDERENDIKAGFFGMPKESDWILYPSYNEKSLMHNTLTMRIARKMGMYASRTQYVEVIVNGSYEGVYVLMEKIKRDKDRVNIAKLEPTSTSGDDLTGGYIIKIDKNTGTNLGTWESKYPNPGNVRNFSAFFYEAPKEITELQKTYIRDYVGKFEDVMFSKDFADPTAGYAKYIDVKSFYMMFILNEFSKNVDGYRISTFLYKDKDSKGGKLTMGPPWDYDIAYGNAEYCEGWRSELFAFRYNDICPKDTWLVPFWWERLISDPVFVGQMRAEYFKLRESGGILDYASIVKEIDQMAAEINEAQKRNFKKWPVLGKYTWPSPQPVPATWELEVKELKDWIQARLTWLDKNLPAQYTALENSSPKVDLKAYPNPFLDTISLRFTSEKEGNAPLEFFDLQGKMIFKKDLDVKPGDNLFNIEVPESFELNGPHILKLTTPEGETVTKKLVKGS
ncbi:T9SS type A sorting domain-containing protein [Emticicia sp. CRIBPO]|uniref:CotH kinase family protein n=1 Tax=Emticicia sp. CRIBPO TaxID=2683258 RepID=UPI001412B674|nr:CotH kinase family protein [Emticicia sp. CRIBPO]NBA85486.1 T9SS type A sorting domain-containing protein [Emticicia sp. CRIBPO]